MPIGSDNTFYINPSDNRHDSLYFRSANVVIVLLNANLKLLYKCRLFF
ncbi:MAG: hypothetical protein ACI93S_000028 [Ancylomarina sp.]|jgi:hypothetical protein